MTSDMPQDTDTTIRESVAMFYEAELSQQATYDQLECGLERSGLGLSARKHMAQRAFGDLGAPTHEFAGRFYVPCRAAVIQDSIDGSSRASPDRLMYFGARDLSGAGE
jgi:hypothetical protein